VIARLRHLRSDESGFTLPELLTAMGVGLIVLLAAAMVLDSSVSTSNEIADRQDAVQRGRLSMEVVTRELRSQVCLKDARPITYGDDYTVSFYANLSNDSDKADLRTLRYEAGEKRLYEDIYEGIGTFPDLTFPASHMSTRHIVSAIVPVKDGPDTRPMFRYYRYVVGGTPGQLQELNTPLSTSDEQRVVLIKAAFVALPERTAEFAGADQDATTFETDVYVRLADPTKPAEGPRCL
jgi:prepilin-type N-terminal cleavage/methylation domain-containing protein